MADITDKFSKVISGTTRPVATTLSAQKVSGATTCSVVATTGWDTDTAVHGIMYRVDGSNVKVPGSQIDWKGVVSGTTISNFTVTAGSDDTYEVGTVVELAPTAAWGDDMATGLVVEHNQDGTHNLPAGAIGADELASNAVTTAKIADAAVTADKLADDGAKTNVKVATIVGITASTSYQTASSVLSLEAGDWILMSLSRHNASVASARTLTVGLYNVTDATYLREEGFRIANDTANNQNGHSVLEPITIGSTKEYRIDIKVSATAGSIAVALRNFIAIRVADLV